MDLINTFGFGALNSNVTALLIFAVVFLLIYLATWKPPGIPPGSSFTLPWLGDLPLLFSGDLVETFKKLRMKHGDVFSFYMGKNLVIIINGYQAIYDSAVKKGELFSGRPPSFINDMGVNLGLVMSTGSYWKQWRKFTHTSLQEFGFGKHIFEEKIMQEVNCFVEVLKSKAGSPYDMRQSIHASVSNVLFSLLCSKRYSYTDEFYKDMLTRSERNTEVIRQVMAAMSCFPFLQYIPGDPLRINEVRSNVSFFKNFFLEEYKEHRRTYDPANCRDLIDCFINEMERQDEANLDKSNFTPTQLAFINIDLFTAGAETTSTALRWAIVYLLNFPEVQNRLQNDIDKVIAPGSAPGLDDKDKLPFVEAFILEVMRFSSIVPLAVPHAVTEEKDVLFKGYRIPKNTSVMFNLDSVLSDPGLFEKPVDFNPNRFLDADNNVKRPKQWIPFGIGRRICLGEVVAKMELFLYLTTLIKTFEFQPPVGQTPPTLKGVLGITHAPQAFEFRAVVR